MEKNTARVPFYGLIKEPLIKKLRIKAKKERRSMVSIIESMLEEVLK